MASKCYAFFCMGDPLVDMQVTNGEELLKKYDLKPNDAIRAGGKAATYVDRSSCAQESLTRLNNSYEDIAANCTVAYVAGGGSQNAARGAAYFLPPDSVVYTGCVGDDELAEQLKAANKREGVDELYLVKKGEQTGACAVIITDHHRSLCTTLRMAEKFELSHLHSPAVAKAIDQARVFYVEGYFLTHGVESALELAKISTRASKTFALNLSAPYLPRSYGACFHRMMPFCDIIICNEAEAESWAISNSLSETKELSAIAKAIAILPKENTSRPRTVVITHGAESTTVVTSDDPDRPKVHPVHPLRPEEIVDTNGAGDAFAGGFLGGLVAGKTLMKRLSSAISLGRCVFLTLGLSISGQRFQSCSANSRP